VSKLKILGIGAHAADVIGRAGGTIAKHVKLGDKCTIVCLSYGEIGESRISWSKPDMNIEKAKRIKHQEAKKAAEIMGAEIRFLDFGDQPLIVDKERLYMITKVIQEVKPDVILTHWLHDVVNYDHAVASKSSIRAIFYASSSGLKLGFLEHNVKEIYMFMPSATTEEVTGFKPGIYVDIADTFELKKKAMQCFESQIHNLNYFTEITGSWRGYQSGVKYAEAFVRFKGTALKSLPH